MNICFTNNIIILIGFILTLIIHIIVIYTIKNNKLSNEEKIKHDEAKKRLIKAKKKREELSDLLDEADDNNYESIFNSWSNAEKDETKAINDLNSFKICKNRNIYIYIIVFISFIINFFNFNKILNILCSNYSLDYVLLLLLIPLQIIIYINIFDLKII